MKVELTGEKAKAYLEYLHNLEFNNAGAVVTEWHNKSYYWEMTKIRFISKGDLEREFSSTLQTKQWEIDRLEREIEILKEEKPKRKWWKL